MRLPLLLLCAGAVVTLPAHAQDQSSDGPGRRNECPDWSSRPVRAFSLRMDGGNRAAIGVTTTLGGMRDTLGLLVTEVVADGPADKAKIEEGDRLQKVNETDLRLSAADAGDREMRGLMARRLIRVLEKLKPGDPIELLVYSDGKTRTVKVTTAKASEAFKDDGLFGFDYDWNGGNTVVRLDGLKDQLSGLGNELSRSFRVFDPTERDGPIGGRPYDLGPGSYRIEVPPVPPVPSVAPVPPAIVTPGSPATPPAPPVDAPRRTMRIRAVAPPASDQSMVVRM